MRIRLPYKFFRGDGSGPAALRKVELPEIARHVMESEGYCFDSKISFPGGYAFEVSNTKGVRKKLGLKTAVNGWLNTATSLVAAMDRILITTFLWSDSELPTEIEFHLVTADKLLAMIDKVQVEAQAQGKDPNGHYYMPIRASEIEDGSNYIGSVAGPVEAIIDETFGPFSLVWGAKKWSAEGSADDDSELDAESDDGDPVTNALAMDEYLSATKRQIATHFGISVDKIGIQLNF